MTSAHVRIPAHVAETVLSHASYLDPSVAGQGFAWLRRNNPLGQVRLRGVHPFWMVTKHADILEISRQNSIFLNGEINISFISEQESRYVQQITGRPTLARMLAQMDAPDHPKHRALTQGWFMPKNLHKLESRLRELANLHLDRMAARGGECDFVDEVARMFPLQVIREILGLPESADDAIIRFATELLKVTTSANSGLESRTALIQAHYDQAYRNVEEFFAYCRVVAEDRRLHPRDDLATAIAQGQIDGEPVEDFEAMSHFMLIATAGHETTGSAIAGAVWGLCENPAQFAALKADPSLISGLAEEAIRWISPVKQAMRSAACDYELRGRQIAKGDWIWLSYISGNRDEEIFDRPDEFQIDRSPNKHLAFGYGAHLCLGLHLAKLEMRVLFEEIARRVEHMELAAPPVCGANRTVSGPRELRIRYRMT